MKIVILYSLSRIICIIHSIILTIFSFTPIGNSDILLNQQKPIESEIRILFVGNSLTYTNNLPVLVEKEALTKGIKVISEMVAFPNYSLEDHWENTTFQAKIKSSTYDFLIIQQGPSSQADGRESLLKFGRLYKNLCSQYDTKLVFFMVWPSLQNYRTFDGVIQNYREAAKANDALLCPVGEIWKDYFDKTGDYIYYGPDGFHLSVEGSKNAAILFAELLFGKK